MISCWSKGIVLIQSSSHLPLVTFYFVLSRSPIFYVLWIRLRNQTRQPAPFQIDRVCRPPELQETVLPVCHDVAFVTHDVDFKNITALNQPFQVLRAASPKYQLDLEIAKKSNFSKLAQNETLRALVTKILF